MTKPSSTPKKKPAAKAGGFSFKSFVIGFTVGVILTIVFFLFGGWDAFARGGDRVERRIRHGMGDVSETVEDAGESVSDKADEWIDSNFKK